MVAICDTYVDWVEKHRSPDTFRWYKDRLQRFVGTIPPALRYPNFGPFHVQQFIDGMEKLSSGTKRQLCPGREAGDGVGGRAGLH